jgi:Zn-dependent M28 family amino/carboxypeptidase
MNEWSFSQGFAVKCGIGFPANPENRETPANPRRAKVTRMGIYSSVRRAVPMLISTALLAACSQPSAPAGTAHGASPSGDPAARWFSHVEALANDDMRGRETGSPEHRKAAEYIAAGFKAAGLQPAGTDGYLQPVAFRSRKINEAQSSLALVRGGKAEPVTLGEEATFGMRIDPAPSVDAGLAFAGHGLQIPELRHDDFSGLDVKGKVVVYITGSPKEVPGALAAHSQSAAERWNTLKRLGAIGVISIANPKSMDVPWERSAPNRLNAAMALADAAFDDTAGQQVSIAFNPAKAERLFAGSGHTFAELLNIADEGKALPHFPLPVSVRAKVAVDTQDLESENVAGVVTGSDPARAGEYVILTAHLDHVGVGAPINGDSIYNGAMDNASGVATLIESASTIAAAKPKRSVLLVAVTAEEKGLLGSRYFALNPTVPKPAIVANINMDMFLPIFPLKSLMVLGLDESDLSDDIRAVAQEMGIGVRPDPQPQRNRFIRSDQYSFIREGVPALAMKVGFEPGSPEEKIDADWTRERYHAPSDDLDQPIDRAAAVGYTEAIGRLSVRVANRAAKPAWKETSFFKRFAQPAASRTTGH